jgi:DNA-binding HxlR family transcriptional regulator
LRYSQGRAACSPISDRILWKELKELESLSRISRKEYPLVAPKTEYRLTALGRTLEPVMAASANRGTSHRAKIVDAAENGRREGNG